MSTNSGQPQRKSPSIKATPPTPRQTKSAPTGVQMVDLASLRKGRSTWYLLLAGAGLTLMFLLVGIVAGAVFFVRAIQPSAVVAPTAVEQPQAATVGATTRETPELTQELLPLPREYTEPVAQVPDPEPIPEPKQALKPDPKPEPKPEPKPARVVKPLSDTVEQGLKFLVKTQQKDGGWSPAAVNGVGFGAAFGGQPTAAPGQELSDLGPTCFATLALFRAGNTTTEGPYAKNVARAVAFILTKVEKCDSRSITTTDLRNTQLQFKIGPHVDTFLSLILLAELKGQMGDEKAELRIQTAMQKLVGKIELNQKDDGTFAGNNAWASVLSQGLAVKALFRARQAGAKVSDVALDRSLKNVLTALDAKMKPMKDPPKGIPGKGDPIGLRPVGPDSSSLTTDAGVTLYSVSAYLAGLREAVTTNQEREAKYKALLADPDARPDVRAKAKAELARLDEAHKLLDKAVTFVSAQGQEKNFVRGVGSNGGEEFLSFLNISETLLFTSPDDYEKWDKTVAEILNKAQDKDGSWSGQHCITGKTFCTAAALLTLMADRAPSYTPKEEKKEKE